MLLVIELFRGIHIRGIQAKYRSSQLNLKDVM